jgi:hypothetical protein
LKSGVPASQAITAIGNRTPPKRDAPFGGVRFHGRAMKSPASLRYGNTRLKSCYCAPNDLRFRAETSGDSAGAIIQCARLNSNNSAMIASRVMMPWTR